MITCTLFSDVSTFTEKPCSHTRLKTLPTLTSLWISILNFWRNINTSKKSRIRVLWVNLKAVRLNGSGDQERQSFRPKRLPSLWKRLCLVRKESLTAKKKRRMTKINQGGEDVEHQGRERADHRRGRNCVMTLSRRPAGSRSVGKIDHWL